MRSPLRIDPFLRAFGDVWHRNPDQRFGQLVMNLTRRADGSFEDPWNWENGEWMRRLEAATREEATPRRRLGENDPGRYEIQILIGPCNEAEATSLMEAVAEFVDERLGGVTSLSTWAEAATREETP